MKTACNPAPARTARTGVQNVKSKGCRAGIPKSTEAKGKNVPAVPSSSQGKWQGRLNGCDCTLHALAGSVFVIEGFRPGSWWLSAELPVQIGEQDELYGSVTVRYLLEPLGNNSYMNGANRHVVYGMHCRQQAQAFFGIPWEECLLQNSVDDLPQETG